MSFRGYLAKVLVHPADARRPPHLVVAFLFADLIVLPIVNIYRKYYGLRVAMLLFVLFYAAMAGAGYVVECVFGVLGLVPGGRQMQIVHLGVTWNYTTVLNILALGVSAILVWRFLRTGGPDMLRMMGSAKLRDQGAP